jgi:hypothetical protein
MIKNIFSSLILIKNDDLLGYNYTTITIILIILLARIKNYMVRNKFLFYVGCVIGFKIVYDAVFVSVFRVLDTIIFSKSLPNIFTKNNPTHFFFSCLSVCHMLNIV